MTRNLYFVAAIFLTACAPTTATNAPAPTTTSTAPSTTTTVPTTTTIPLPVVSPPRARTSPRAGRGVAASEGMPADDFWHRLAMCESGMRSTVGRHVGFFQFSPDTAAKVGIDGSEGYEEQRAAAQEWARRIHPREGTRAGWPVCWGRAL